MQYKSNNWVLHEAQRWVDITTRLNFDYYSSFERKNELVLLFFITKNMEKVIFLYIA